MPSILPRCPGCKIDVLEEKKFCTSCGYNLENRREEKRKSIRIQQRKEEKKASLKNCYQLMLITFLPLMPVLIASKIEKYQNSTMMASSWIGAGLIIGYMLTKKVSFKEMLFSDKNLFGWCLAGLIFCGGLLALNFAYHMIFTSFFDLEADNISSSTLDGGMSLAAVFFFVAVMPGIWEEVLFRGLLLDELEVIVTPTEAAVLSSVIFSLFHLSVFSFPYLALFGFVLVILKRKCNSLVPGMIVHSLHNAAIVAHEVWF